MHSEFPFFFRKRHFFNDVATFSRNFFGHAVELILPAAAYTIESSRLYIRRDCVAIQRWIRQSRVSFFVLQLHKAQERRLRKLNGHVFFSVYR